MSSASSSTTATAAPASNHDLWVAILKEIEPQLQRTQFITWFRDTAVLGLEEGDLIVGLPLPMSLNWHLEKYRSITLEAAQKVEPTVKQVVYKVEGSLKDNPDDGVNLLEHFPEVKKRKLPGKQEVKMVEGLVGKILNPRYTLEHFIVGDNNRLAAAAAQAVASNPGGKYNPLFVYGHVGLGKTHLIQATGNEILRRHPKSNVLYTTSEDFTNEVVEAIRTQKMERLRSRYRKVDVLIIDDIQFLASKERTQEEFFHTFNALYENHKQVIISADRPPQELPLADRLTSRFARGMIADVSAPDYETRLAIVREKAQQYELFIENNILEFIAEHMDRNIRELEGILMQAVAQYELEQRMPTIKSIADIMGKLGNDIVPTEECTGFEKPEKRQATFQQTLEVVSEYYSISIDDMVGKSRVMEIQIPRQICMLIGKRHQRMSYVHLGEVFGGRDHSTIMNACSRMERRMQSDPQLLREVRAIEKELGFLF